MKKEENCEIWRSQKGVNFLWEIVSMIYFNQSFHKIMEPEGTPHFPVVSGNQSTLYLSQGTKIGSKEKAYKCLEIEDMLQATGPVDLKFCCHQKHLRSFLKIGNLVSIPHTWIFSMGRSWESALSGHQVILKIKDR